MVQKITKGWSGDSKYKIITKQGAALILRLADIDKYDESTTFSTRNSLNSDVAYDYLIMDEVSQVDIATGHWCFPVRGMLLL